LPDFYTRVHAQTVIVVGGVTLALLGLMIANPEYWLKIALIISFLLITSPTGSHAIARAAYKSGQKPWGRP
jgi:multicomponent Na+:H+ antiporter subunit G